MLLKPFVKLCVGHSIGLREVTEVLKITFVEVAEKELQKSKEKINSSKISALTGVHRKDVTSIFSSKHSLAKAEGSILTKVIGQWQHDKSFCSSKGKARILTCEGDKSEFAKLVRSVTSDLNPYTVLNELKRIEAVKESEGLVRLAQRIYSPKQDIKEGFRLLASDTSDLVGAVTENIFLKQEIPNHHLKTSYDNIPTSALPQIREWLFKEGSAFHEKTRNFLSKFDRDTSSYSKREADRSRVAFGSFSFIETFQRGDTL